MPVPVTALRALLAAADPCAEGSATVVCTYRDDRTVTTFGWFDWGTPVFVPRLPTGVDLVVITDGATVRVESPDGELLRLTTQDVVVARTADDTLASTPRAHAVLRPGVEEMLCPRPQIVLDRGHPEEPVVGDGRTWRCGDLVVDARTGVLLADGQQTLTRPRPADPDPAWRTVPPDLPPLPPAQLKAPAGPEDVEEAAEPSGYRPAPERRPTESPPTLTWWPDGLPTWFVGGDEDGSAVRVEVLAPPGPVRPEVLQLGRVRRSAGATALPPPRGDCTVHGWDAHGWAWQLSWYGPRLSDADTAVVIASVLPGDEPSGAGQP